MELSDALQDEREELEAEIEEHAVLENEFLEEQEFIHYFEGEPADIITLDVAGEKICAKRSTLMMCPESALARQFDDKVSSQGKGESDSDSEDEGVFIEQISLASLSHMTWVCCSLSLLILRTCNSSVTNTPHPEQARVVPQSAYCFTKMLDHLRLKAIASEGDEPPPPKIEAYKQKDFHRMINFYFPGKESYILGA